MKKLFLLFAVSALAGVAKGQEAAKSILSKTENQTALTSTFDGQTVSNGKQDLTALNGARTTVTMGRWYDYADTFLNNFYQSGGCHGVPSTGSTLLTMWGDTTAEFGYSDGTFGLNTWTSVGQVILPFDNYWNNTIFNAGQMAIRSTDAYSVDSIIAVGIYGRSYATPAKRAVTDHIKFGLVHGTGATGTDLLGYYFHNMTNYCVDTLRYLQMFHDSLNNTAANSSASTVLSEHTYTFNLVEADTSTSMYFAKAFPLSPAFSVPAGSAVGAAVSFQSGDYPTTGSSVPRDTVQYTDGTFKYGCFLPQIIYNGTGGTTPIIQFMEYGWPSDHTVGHFKREGAGDAGWGGFYIPGWAWTTSSGPSALQIPRLLFHLTCTTCLTIGTASLESNNITALKSVKIYPNPAVSDLNIEFSLSQATKISASLSNVMGQVVATQDLGNVASGKVTFNTANLANGVYFYEFLANGSRSTGHVVVAH